MKSVKKIKNKNTNTNKVMPQIHKRIVQQLYKLKMKAIRTKTLAPRMALFIGFLFIATNIFSQDPNFHIYLCFGQSNMEGQGTIETQDRTVDSRFQVFQALDCSNLGRTRAAWYTAVPPLCQCWSKLSPADYFGRTMIQNLPDSIKVGVINVSIAGCDIRLFDKDIYQDYDSTYTESWFTNKVRDYGWNPYQHLIDLAQLAQQDGVIKGILLHQGETNTGNAQWPSYVKKIYDDMLTDLSLDAESIPLLAGEVVNADQGGICASMNNIIAKLPQAITNSYVISSSGCTDAPDNLHFDSEGYRVLGGRYAEKMLSLLGYEVVGVNELKTDNAFVLGQNYPNPFKDKTSISFELPNDSYVTLKVYSMLGEEIAELAGKEYTSGIHHIEYTPGYLSQGSYIYMIKTNKYTSSREMILLKE